MKAATSFCWLALTATLSVVGTDAFSLTSSKPVVKVPLQASTMEEADTQVTSPAMVAVPPSTDPPFKTIMAANRAEIAVRIMRAATELNSGTVGVYVQEDASSQHRWAADRSFRLEKDDGASPISAYLDIPQLIEVAVQAGVDAIHPGYGFLSESPYPG